MALRTLPKGENELHQTPHLQTAAPRKQSIWVEPGEDGEEPGTRELLKSLEPTDFSWRDLRQLAGFGH